MSRPAKVKYFSNTKGPQRFRYQIIGGNGQIIVISESFPSMSNAKRAARRLILACYDIAPLIRYDSSRNS